MLEFDTFFYARNILYYDTQLVVNHVTDTDT